MVKITIIGWYGTETIGDRAILAGLFRLFFREYGDYEVRLGAIYPFYTEKTLLEDEDFLRTCNGERPLRVSVFDSRSPKALRGAIHTSDVVAIGGGPLYDSPAMFMLEYALKYARHKRKQTMILGCGIGPLYRKVYRNTLLRILRNTDIAIFRDQVSKQEADRLCGSSENFFAAIDPAVIALSVFDRKNPKETDDDEYIAVAIRAFPGGFKLAPGLTDKEVDKEVAGYLEQMQEATGKEIRMIPMNYCDSGGDDRKIMNAFRFQSSNIHFQVQNEPLNTFQTMQVFRNAWGCAGMRFHSVVFQTILNGNNLILDYTDAGTGKIGNFLQQIQATEHYRDSYVNLLEGCKKEIGFNLERYVPDWPLIENFEKVYLEYLKIR